jgi:GT2 family glycosyltransferase
MLKEVIISAFSEGVDKVIVIDNNSENNSRSKLCELQKEIGANKLIVKYLSENTGSSGGFNMGLKVARKCDDCTFVWLLDDDNKASPGSLKKLGMAYNYLGNSSKNILSSSRSDGWSIYHRMGNTGDQFYYTNCFLDFSISRKLADFFCKKSKYMQKYSMNFPIIRAEIAPYGGLFFNIKILDLIGYPNKDYYLYADDHEFTLRMSRLNFNIYICLESKIVDLQDSIKVDNLPTIYSENIGNTKVFYGIRNHTYLSLNEFVNNKIFFYINMVAYMLYSTAISLYYSKNKKLVIRRVIVSIKAIIAGHKKTLSK